MQLMFMRHRQRGKKELEWVLDVKSTNEGLSRAMSIAKKITFGLSGPDLTSDQNSDRNLSVHITLRPGLRV